MFNVDILDVFSSLLILFTSIVTLTFTRLSCISTVFTICTFSSLAFIGLMLLGCSDPQLFVYGPGIGSVVAVVAIPVSVANFVADLVLLWQTLLCPLRW